VIQGSLGDCWFLGAISVLATREKLLRKVVFNFISFSLYLSLSTGVLEGRGIQGVWFVRMSVLQRLLLAVCDIR